MMDVYFGARKPDIYDETSWRKLYEEMIKAGESDTIIKKVKFTPVGEGPIRRTRTKKSPPKPVSAAHLSLKKGIGGLKLRKDT